VDRHDDFALAALATLVHASGSLVIGLAVAEGEITAEQAGHAAQLDELYQAERWGEDKEAIDRRVAQLAELVAARRFLDLLAQD
jgi:chaperone required for assembly of F1-ATPase